MKLFEKQSIFENDYGDTVTITGKIKGEPKYGSHTNRYEIRIDKVEFTEKNLRILFPDENIIISTTKYPQYQTGDLLQVTGKLQKPENFDNDNGLEFDYVNFLAKDNIYSLMYYSKVTILNRNKFNIERKLYESKQYFLEKISTVIPSPESELMGGLLLGVKQSLGEDIENEYRRAGLIHVVVLSGFHITVVILAVFKFLIFLPKYLKYIFGIIFLLCFAIMVGFGSTVVRASIMAIFAIMGKISSRNYNVNRSLFMAGLIMVIGNPMIIFYDLSFHLSFVASLGLVNFSGYIKNLLKFITNKFEIREIMAATISTQIAVLPLLLRMTGELSIISLPANLIVLPTVPLTMFSGFTTGVLAIIFYPAGQLFGFLTYILLNFQLKVVRFFASLSFATIQLNPPSFLETILFYSLLVIFFHYRPIQILEKVFDILTFPARLIIRHK